MPIVVGTRFGAYEIVSLIGSGGMGEVYRARDLNLKRDVALKVLPAAFASDVVRLARFQREAEVLASLNHPNIAQIYGIERGVPGAALAMELVEGPTLADRIARGRIPAGEALRIAGQIVDALEAAHERGIVHRDLKPANILLRPDGVAKVLDFGLAKALDPVSTAPAAEAPTLPMLTEVGVVMGTAAYMSPEQARGSPVDQRTDIWAFGCVLYEMLTGQRAFRADDPAGTLVRVLEGNVDMKALPSSVPAPVRRTIELCLRKEPRRRLRDIGDVRLALEGELAGPAPPRPRWLLSPLAAMMVVLAASMAVAYLIVQMRPAPGSPVAPPAVSRLFIVIPTSTPLASLGGLDLAIAPDARRIVYFAQVPGSNDRFQLYVRELDGLDARPLAGTEVPGRGAGNMNPFFSPDGKSVGLFVPDRGVISIPIEGGPPVKILDPPVPGFIGASWAADNTLIYSSGFRLQRVSAAGGASPMPLTPATEGRLVASPVPLPGGRAVVFHILAGDTNQIAALNLETKLEKSLVDGASNMSYLDTGHLVFARGDTLMAVPFNVPELALAGDPVSLVQGIRHPAGGAADYVISANGTLAYVPASDATEATYAVVWVDRRGNVVERAVRDLVVNGRDPRLSPDGKHFLLVTGLLAAGDLWNYDLGGRPPLPLGPRNNNVSPVWNSAGREVAFTTGTNEQVLTIPADGAVRSPQALSVSGMPQAWLPNGELLFQWPMGNPDILSTSVASGETRKIVASEYGEFHPDLSPSGRWLAYVSNRTGQNEIWVQGYPDGVPVRVSTNGGDEPLWSADGRELFYRRGQTMMVVAVGIKKDDFEFDPPQPLFSGPFAPTTGEFSRSYDVADDGRFVMLLPADANSTRTTASIIVVQNFIEELKQRVRRSTP
jgi:serine/threonine-protein kinase